MSTEKSLTASLSMPPLPPLLVTSPPPTVQISASIITWLPWPLPLAFAVAWASARPGTMSRTKMATRPRFVKRLLFIGVPPSRVSRQAELLKQHPYLLHSSPRVVEHLLFSLQQLPSRGSLDGAAPFEPG